MVLKKCVTKMKGGAHQSLLTLMRTLVCLHKEGMGLAICDRGICFCMGKDLEVGKRKGDKMEDCYDFDGNRGWCWKLTQATRLGVRLLPDANLL